jgi:hypothetical protein
MATVQLHPMFVSLHGNLGGLVHVNRYGRQYVRRHVVPFNPNTVSQQHCRKSFAEAVAAWQGLAPYKQNQWNARARVQKRKGYNLFIAEFMREKRAAANYSPDRESIRGTSYLSSSSSFIINNSSSAKEQLRCRTVVPAATECVHGLAEFRTSSRDAAG